MKKLWVNLLVALLLTALAMTCSAAETKEAIILDDVSDMDIRLVATDEIVLDDADATLDLSGLPEFEDDTVFILDSVPETLDPSSVAPGNATQSNDDGDFDISKGVSTSTRARAAMW